MADYTYYIYDAASNTAPNFTTWAGARNDFAANNRMGAGTGVYGSGVLYFKKRGHSSSAGNFNLVAAAGISKGSGGSIVIEADTNPWNASTATALAFSSSYDGCTFANDEGIATDLDAVTIRNLVLAFNITSGGGGTGISVTHGVGGMTTVIESCALKQTANTNCSVVHPQAATTIRNCLLKQNSTDSNACTVDLYLRHSVHPTVEQCTLISAGGSTNGVRDTTGSGASLTNFKNTYSGGATNPYGGLSAGSAVGCASSSTDAPGTGNINSVAYSTTNFTSVTGDGDFKVTSGSVLKTTGATRLASALTDAYGQSRSTTTTIGAYAAEVGGGGGSTVPIHLLRTLQIP